jgi:hypothetical protein
MADMSFSAHISQKKSGITSKTKLEGVAKHNLRKYKSDDYSANNIVVLQGTHNLVRDVKTVYHQIFDDSLKAYNERQKRADRKIADYFEHVANKEQDMAVEIIIQLGDREYWNKHRLNRAFMKYIYKDMLDELKRLFPDFIVANAVVHLDEDSPHMHIVGVPVAIGYKRGLDTQVSKRTVFTPERLSVLLQGKLREFANRQVKSWFDEQIKEKAKGRNHDLAVVEYKVAKEVEKYLQVKKQMENKQKKLDELQEQEYEIIRKAEIAKEVYDMVLDSHDSDFELREKMIDIMWENDKLKHEVSKLKETLDKAYGYMKQFVVDGRNMLERFKETLDVNIKKLTRDLWK